MYEPTINKVLLLLLMARWPRPFTTRVSTLAMESGNVFSLQDFEQNEIKFKQRGFKDSIGTFFSLFDADLLLTWMNTFRQVSASVVRPARSCPSC